MTGTLLHLADVHLEAPFSSGNLPPALGARRRQDLREALQRALALARKHRVDAVTIAGDLYDGRYALPETGAFLSRAFAALAPIPIIIASGSADPYDEDSLYTLTAWPDNVTVLPPGVLSSVAVAPDLHVWGAAWGADATRLFSATGALGGGRHVVLLHAPLTVPDRQHPVGLSPEAVRAAGFEYALLGGRHAGGAWPSADAHGCYAGSLEPLAPDEMAGERGPVLLRFGDDACVAEWLRVGRWRYVSLEVDATGCVTPAEVARRIEGALRHDRVRTDERAIATVTVYGLPEDGLESEAIRAEIETRAHVVIVPRRPLPYELDRLAKEHTVRGLLVRRLSLAGDAEPACECDVRQDALNLALRALDGKGVRPGEIA